MSAPDLRALGLDDASLDRAYDAALARLAAAGVDVDAVVERAAANLLHWREHPATWDPDAVPADLTGDPC